MDIPPQEDLPLEEAISRLHEHRKFIDQYSLQPGLFSGPIHREYKHHNASFPIENTLYKKVFDYLVYHHHEMINYPGREVLLTIHTLLAGEGFFRQKGVKIGRFRHFPHSSEVPSAIDRMFEDISNEQDAILQSIKAHVEILLIHPFADGNGRSARLMAAFILLKAGFKSTLFTAVEQHFYHNPRQYIQWLVKYRTGEINKEDVWRGFANAMYLHSYYGYYIRKRASEIVDQLTGSGMAYEEAWKQLYEYDAKPEFNGRKPGWPSQYLKPMALQKQALFHKDEAAYRNFEFQLRQLTGAYINTPKTGTIRTVK
ncbi:Fic family protein [Fulvivirga sp. 29W222]|uniref:Fic family protein n=1 Tax=Fulvivirga marina TaxID=2494733 RepID=A0A937KDH7_9BACT|nr:Fic family protein [Fulvivirga marina]MBL6448622.1 Fic family protein [Fulvivirga marina]